MPITVTCDLCGAQMQSLATLGKTEATTCVPDTEKHCPACTLAARLDEWTTTRLNAVVQEFVTNRVPEQEQYFVTSLKSRFLKYAQEAAKAHFGSLYDTALPIIQAEVLALADTPVNVSTTFGS